ncbi:MAG: sigma factor-like helix-turn-helix DNA-binding protein, partial [Planctomycetota bacterium]
DTIDLAIHPADGSRDREEALGRCLHHLGEEHREVLSRRYAESQSVKAIAADLGVTPNAVSLTLHRARQKLMNCMQKRLDMNGQPG